MKLKFLSVSAVIAATLALSACDYVGVGYSGVDSSVRVVGYPYYGSSYYGYYRSYPRYYYPRGRYYGNRYRRYGGSWRNEYRRRGGRHHLATSTMRATNSGANYEVSFPELFAERFQLSADSATHLLNALEKSQSGDTGPLTQLGLSANDVQRLSRFEMPSDTGLDRLARKLDQHPSATRKMIQNLTSTSRERVKAFCNSGIAAQFAEACRR